MPELAALVLAAGAGRRMGKPKALVTWDGETFLARVLRTLAAVPGIDSACVVLGAEAEAIRKAIPLPPGVRAVVNDGWERGGMLSSLLVGLKALEDAGSAAGGLLVWPVDHPAVREPTVATLARAYARAKPAIALPSYDGRHGHPVVFAPATYGDLRRAPPSRGARAVVRQHASSCLAVPVDDPGVVRNVDRPEDLAELARFRLD